MRYGIVLTTGDPRMVADLAAESEDAGWDGAFYWDAIAIGRAPTFDPWVVMAGIAMRTERLRFGAILTPPSRRRPWKLAREALTLDHLSNGRLILPVGLGTLDDAGFGNVGESTETRTRAELLDESLEILDGLWSGKPFAYEGRHYRFGKMTFLPRPVQRPRIPVWVAAAWPRERSMRRALRYDGILPQAHDARGNNVPLTPGHIREIAAYVAAERPAELRRRPFDIVGSDRTPVDDQAAAAEMVRPWADAGATWWVEADWESSSVESLRRRIRAGPPRIERLTPAIR